MKPLFTDEQYQLAKSTDKLPCECYQCGETFLTHKKEITRVLSGKAPYWVRYCSRNCFKSTTRKQEQVECAECGTQFMKKQSDIKKAKNHFCTKSCAATYNNKNKTHGTKRSKLEAYIEEQLTSLYPELEFHFNRKDAIGSELDVYIPSLNVAFELNGIFHYEPIYGPDKLKQINENDISKSKACHDAKIDLCVIDTSQQKNFTEKSSQRYLDIITNIINERLLSIS